MIAATLLMAIAAVDAEALHRQARRGTEVHHLAIEHVRSLATAGAILALPILLQAIAS